MISLRKSKKTILLLTILFILSFLVFASYSLASVGNSSSHSSSSSSHSSSSSSSHSSSSSSFGSSGSSSSGSSSGIGSSIAWIIFLFVLPELLILVVVAILVIYFVRKRRRSDSSEQQELSDFGHSGDAHNWSEKRAELDYLYLQDPNFSEEQFLSRVNNMFIQLQEAWQHKEWKKVRPFESDALFNMHSKQLQEYIDTNRTNVVAEIAILKTNIANYHAEGVTESLDVYMRTRFKDYIINDETKKVVEGDPNQEIYMEYLLVMTRKKGVLSKLVQDAEVSTCPNCGANVSINAAGECDYCGSVVINGEFDWVLTRMDVISQKS